MEYSIKITGSGESAAIVKSLRKIADCIEKHEDLVGAEIEDATLIAEISEPEKLNKTFQWKDKTGRGMSEKISMSAIDNDPEETNWDGTTLFEWAQDAEPGDTWENASDRYTCISEY